MNTPTPTAQQLWAGTKGISVAGLPVAHFDLSALCDKRSVPAVRCPGCGKYTGGIFLKTIEALKGCVSDLERALDSDIGAEAKGGEEEEKERRTAREKVEMNASDVCSSEVKCRHCGKAIAGTLNVKLSSKLCIAYGRMNKTLSEKGVAPGSRLEVYRQASTKPCADGKRHSRRMVHVHHNPLRICLVTSYDV